MKTLIHAIALCLVLAAAPALAGDALMLATTTSTDNTGLLDELAPLFRKDTGIELKWTAVGTGKALKMGENCDVDALLVHAPAAEKAFVDKGFGKDRQEIMYNDFVAIGPPSDPAGVKGMSPDEALVTIKARKADFASRGDNSGTNKKELGLWRAAGIDAPDKESWYIQTGQGMLKTITVAEERNAYTLTDRGTYIKYEANAKGNPELVVLVEGDPSLFNQYSVIAIDPAHCPDARYDLAGKFAAWLTSDSVQKAIGDFRLLGKRLFTPNAK